MYIPITKALKGDLEALGLLNPEILSDTKPLIQIPPTPSKAELMISRINAALSTKSATIYLDFKDIDNTQESLDYVRYVLDEIDTSIRIIPVIYSNTSVEKLQLYNPFIIENGVCLRIKDLFRSNNVAQIVQSTISSFGLNKSDTDLLLDYEYVNSSNVDDVTDDCIRTITTLGNGNYRNLGLASGSFMQNLGPIAANTVYEFPRVEYEFHRRVKNQTGMDLFFSDYGNQHPLPGTDTRYGASCSIKYTSDNSYVVFRGQQPGKVQRGSAQYFDKARLLVEHACYDGPEFSWADGNILERANSTNERRPGNAGTWVTITMNRHITKIHHMVN
jgi:hypothetical protein